MDEYRLKISDSVNIPVPLDLDTDYGFVGTISVYGDSRASKEDGTYVVTYKARFFTGIELIKGEKIYSANDKASWSQKMRRAILSNGLDYDKAMAFYLRPENFARLAKWYEANTDEDTEALGD